MRDERILRELNRTKMVIIKYIIIATVIWSLLKYFLIGLSRPLLFLSEAYLLLMGLILLLSRLLIFSEGVDERTELKFEKTANIVFALMFFGSLFVHFYTNSLFFNVQLAMMVGTPVSLFILIGFIVLLRQLRKRRIFLHNNLFFLDKKAYITKIAQRCLVFGLIMAANILFYIINEADLLFGAIVIGFSFISLSTTYTFFAIFEYNDYNEQEEQAEGKIRNLPKNAAFLYVIPLFYSFCLGTISLIQSLYIIIGPAVSTLTNIAVLSKLVSLYSLDVAIISTIVYVLIRNRLKLKNVYIHIIKLINVFIWSGLIIAFINYVNQLFSPLIVRFMFDVDMILLYSKISSYSSVVFFLYITVLMILIALKLKIYYIPYINYFYLHILLPVLGGIIRIIGLKYESGFLIVIGAIATFSASIIFFMFLLKHKDIIKEEETETNSGLIS
jgi:hypothetical protein